MKRSEAAGLIKEYLDGKPMSENWPYEILNAVESIGMIPPIEPGRTVYDLDLGVPEWEEE